MCNNKELKNMKRILYITIAAVVLSTNGLIAQNKTDALRWSQYFYDGTARFSAMGGAFGALGGDMASLSVNPAGIGVYRSAEFLFTPSYSITNTKASFANQSLESGKLDRGDFNFGYVQPLMANNSNQGLVSLNFGLAINTVNDFGYNSFALNRSKSSWLDALVNKMENDREYFDPAYMEGNNRYNDFYPSEWDAVLGWNSALINEDTTGFYNVLGVNDVIEQGRLVESRGRNMEYAISFGGNYNNRLFFGLTLGIQDINYKKYITHSEDIVETSASNPTDLRWFDYRQYFETQGNGFNLKLGLLYRATDNLRFGLAVHTPTWLNLKDYYQASMESQFETTYYNPDVTPTNEYEYKVSTPARYNLSAAYLFDKYGAISLDYEYVDYSTMTMKDRYTQRTGNSFNDDNIEIKKEFAGASNIRLGVEFKPVDNFSLRAGYAFYGSPYKDSVKGGDPTRQSFSFGLGYRFDGYFIDAAYKYTTTQSGLYKIYSN
jgi:hypothetical protein